MKPNKTVQRKLDAINKADLSAAEKERIERFLKGDTLALRKRDKVLGLKFASEDIKCWKACAEAAGKTFSDWVEEALECQRLAQS